MFQLDRRALVHPVRVINHNMRECYGKKLFQTKECTQYDSMDFLLSAFEYYDSMHMGTEYCSRTSSFNRKHVPTINTRPYTHLSHAAVIFFSSLSLFHFFSIIFFFFFFHALDSTSFRRIFVRCFLFGSNT